MIAEPALDDAYELERQVGFILRQVQQRHAALFAAAFGDLTPMQWAALAKLADAGECSQNRLGRLVSMDVATVKGVVERLVKRGLAEIRPDPEDRRRILVRPTTMGLSAYRSHLPDAVAVSEQTLEPLAPAERDTLIGLLRKLR